jgi:putative transposase
MKNNIQYKSGASSVYSLKYHLVFCPKYRKHILVGDVETRLKELLTEKALQLGVEIHIMETMPDHVHMFIETSPIKPLNYTVSQLKGFTSRMLRKEFPHLKSKLPSLWTRSYYIGSIGHVSEKTVRQYIANQKTK